MFGFMIGALAVAWGVLVAVLDQPTEAAGRLTSRLCAALLGCAAVTVAGGVAAATVHW